MRLAAIPRWCLCRLAAAVCAAVPSSLGQAAPRGRVADSGRAGGPELGSDRRRLAGSVVVRISPPLWQEASPLWLNDPQADVPPCVTWALHRFVVPGGVVGAEGHPYDTENAGEVRCRLPVSVGGADGWRARFRDRCGLLRLGIASLCGRTSAQGHENQESRIRRK